MNDGSYHNLISGTHLRGGIPYSYEKRITYLFIVLDYEIITPLQIYMEIF